MCCLVKPDPVNCFAAWHATKSLLSTFITQVNNTHVFTGVDLKQMEKSVIQISWFLDLFWRWEVKIGVLRNDVFHSVFIGLHGNTFSHLNTRHLPHSLSKLAARQPSSLFFIEDYGQIIIVMKDSKKMDIFVCWLALKYILLLLTHFQKTNTMAIVTTCASADVTKL